MRTVSMEYPNKHFISETIELEGAAQSMPGGRSENQDEWLFQETPLGTLIIVCDGMGGGPCGRMAAHIVSSEFAKFLTEADPKAPHTETIHQATKRVHEAIQEKVQEDQARQGMGSTYVALLINEESATIAHVGDSRCYHLRGNNVEYRTIDHSIVAELVQRKALTEEEARTSPQSNVITQVIGGSKEPVADVIELPYCKGDRFVLCSDGVWGSMPEPQLLKRISNNEPPETWLEALGKEIDLIGQDEGGHHDNHTIVVADVRSDSTKRPNRQLPIAKMATAIVFCSCAIAMIVLWPKTVLVGSTATDPKDSVFMEVPSASEDTSSIEVPGEKSNCSISVVSETQAEEPKTILQPNQLNEVKTLLQMAINRYNEVSQLSCKKEENLKADIANKRKDLEKIIDNLKEMPETPELSEAINIVEQSLTDKYCWYYLLDNDSNPPVYQMTCRAKRGLNKQVEKLKVIRESLKA